MAHEWKQITNSDATWTEWHLQTDKGCLAIFGHGFPLTATLTDEFLKEGSGCHHNYGLLIASSIKAAKAEALALSEDKS